jgi:hypothetical protein
MVHGIDYGLRLVIKTDRPEPIDYFNDVLKISIDIRKELYKGGSNSFVVFELSHLIKRLDTVEKKLYIFYYFFIKLIIKKTI